MRLLLFIGFVLLSRTYFTQERLQVSILSTIDSPVKSKTPYFNTSIGLGYQISYKPFESIPLYVDFDNSYAYCSRLNLNRSKVIYFDNLTPFTHNYSVNYTSHFNKFLFGAKWVFGNDYRKYNMFITPQLGFCNSNATFAYEDVQNPYWSNSRYNDYDQDDVQFQSHRIKFFRSNTFLFGGNLGVSFNMNELIGLKSNMMQRLFVRGSFYMSNKNKFQYTNMDYVIDQNHSNLIISRTIDYQNLPNNSNANEIGKYPILTNQLMIWGIQIGYTFVF